MLSPIVTLFKHFPLRAFSTLLILLAVVWYTYKRLRRSWEQGRVSKQRAAVIWLLISYVLLLLFFTVLGRRSLEYCRYNFNVGYSYREAFSAGDAPMAAQIAANIAVFVPVGLLGTLAPKRLGFLKALLGGIALTVCIELLQLVLRCGTAEIDDLISNGLGTLVGCCSAVAVRLIDQYFIKK